MANQGTRDILVTSALPYANGPLHLGHILEVIQTDIWVRFQKEQGNRCFYVCADDAHGTAIMLKAEEAGITPEAHIANIKAQHENTFKGFSIGFDHFHTTHSEENRLFSEDIYKKLQANGHIAKKSINQLFDPEKSLFLADRFIKGTCPKCKTPDQYGDNCESCGSTYTPADLIDPVSALSGAKPVMKESEHYFFTLDAFTDFLKDWTRSGHLQEAVSNKLQEWLEAGLQPWDISRDAPYFGFEIPDAPGKYFYVWLDAPIGYMASFKALCDKQNLDFNHFWGKHAKAELYHFIGKDIINFHALFWPSMLESADYRTPTGVFAHGFITVNGQKMSKSRGTFINADDYLKHLDPESLRYYYASKLTAQVDDIDLNLEDFLSKVNTDIVNKLVNIASRCAKFITKGNAGLLSASLEDPELWKQAIEAKGTIAQLYETREFSKAIKHIMSLADAANKYIDDKAPWALAKDPANKAQVIEICSMGLNLFKLLVTYLKPVMPEMADKAAAFLKSELSWQTSEQPLLDHTIDAFKPLAKRLETKQIEALVTPTQPTTKEKKKKAKTSAAPDTITIDQFNAVDLRAVKIVKAETVEGADKLLKLSLDVGKLGQRTVFSGIRENYQADDLEGTFAILVANLAPRKMKFGLSEGMVLAAGSGKSVQLIRPDEGANPGDKVS